MKLPDLIKSELSSLKVPYEIKAGSRHQKIIVNGRLCGIIPMTGKSTDRRAELNVRSQIRRAARG